MEKKWNEMYLSKHSIEIRTLFPLYLKRAYLVTMNTPWCLWARGALVLLVANTISYWKNHLYVKIYSCSFGLVMFAIMVHWHTADIIRTPFCVGCCFPFKQIEHFGQVMVVFESQLNLMYSPGLSGVSLVSLCGFRSR